MITDILWGPPKGDIYPNRLYDPNSPLSDNLEPYSSNSAEIFANVPSWDDMQKHGSDWVVQKLKRACGGHVAGCAYNDH